MIVSDTEFGLQEKRNKVEKRNKNKFCLLIINSLFN